VLKREQKATLNAVASKTIARLSEYFTSWSHLMSLKLISLFQLVPIVVDRLEKVRDSCVLVGSPLNAIISDETEKFLERGAVVKVLKQGNQDTTCNTSIDDWVKFVYGHTEAIVEITLLRTLLIRQDLNISRADR